MTGLGIYDGDVGGNFARGVGIASQQVGLAGQPEAFRRLFPGSSVKKERVKRQVECLVEQAVALGLHRRIFAPARILLEQGTQCGKARLREEQFGLQE